MNTQDKLCILYDGADNAYEAEAKQVKIIFHQKSKNFEKYIEQNQDKHIYIELKLEDYNIDTARRFQTIKQFNNWTLQIPVEMILTKDKKVDELKFTAIKDCCNKYMFTDLIGNWEILQFILSLKPSEVYVTNILGFYLPDVSSICGKAGAGVRVIANVAQSSWDDSPALTKFFIRPEDVAVYAPFVSGFDFVGSNNVQEVCYKVYSRGYWYGNLKELIIGFNEDLDSRQLPPSYGQYRLGCKKRCITGSSCHLCKTISDLAIVLDKAGMQVVPPTKIKNTSLS